MIDGLLGRVTDAAFGLAIFVPVVAITLPVSWWCARTYSHIVRKGSALTAARNPVRAVAVRATVPAMRTDHTMGRPFGGRCGVR